MKSRSSRVRTSESAYVVIGALMAAIFICTGAFASDYSGAAQSRTTNTASNKLILAYDPEEEGGRLPPPGGGPGAPDGEFQPAGPPPDGQFPRRQRRFPNGEFRGPDGGPGEGMPGRRFRGGGNPDGGGGPGGEGSGRPGGFGGRGQGGFPGGQGGRGGFRGPGGQGMPGGMQRRPAIDLTPLNLTEEQKTKIEGMRQQTRTKVKELRRGMMQKQAQMRNLMFSPDASDAQIRSAREELRVVQNQVDETNLNDLLGIRALLTVDQKKHLPECMPGRKSRIGTQWGAGGGEAERRVGARISESSSDTTGVSSRRELRRQMKQQFGGRKQIESGPEGSSQ